MMCQTKLFCSRIDLIKFTSISTTDFIGNWTAGQDSFAVDVPNAVLVVDEQEGMQDVVIIELFNPVYDVYKKSLKYNVTPDNDTSIDLPSEFGESTMIIDPAKDSIPITG